MPAGPQIEAHPQPTNLGSEPWRLAHDLNNILNIIDGYAKLLRERLPAGSREQKMAIEIEGAVVRGTALAERLRASKAEGAG